MLMIVMLHIDSTTVLQSKVW